MPKAKNNKRNLFIVHLLKNRSAKQLASGYQRLSNTIKLDPVFILQIINYIMQEIEKAGFKRVFSPPKTMNLEAF